MSDLRPNIWLLQAQGDSKGLIDALQNSDPDVRRRAATALRVLGSAEALPALRRALDAETDAETRGHLELAFESLMIEQQEAESEQASATRQLIAQLKSSDPAIIIKAAHALGKLNDKTAVETLILLFHNTQLPAAVRLTAAEALIELESAPAQVTLLAALRSPTWQIRRNAAAILGQLRADWAAARLADRLRDDHEQVRRTARAALQRIGTPAALQALDIAARERARPRSSPAIRPGPPVSDPAPAAADSGESREAETQVKRPAAEVVTLPASEFPPAPASSTDETIPHKTETLAQAPEPADRAPVSGADNAASRPLAAPPEADRPQ